MREVQQPDQDSFGFFGWAIGVLAWPIFALVDFSKNSIEWAKAQCAKRRIAKK